jgi:hypothetical protein
MVEDVISGARYGIVVKLFRGRRSVADVPSPAPDRLSPDPRSSFDGAIALNRWV